MPYTGHTCPHAIDTVQIVGMNAQHDGAAMRGHINEVLGRQPVIDGHDDRSELRYCVELLEMLMRVGRDGRNPVALAHPQLGKRGAPPVATPAELLIGEAQIAVDDGLAPAMQFARAAHEFQGCQWGFHRKSVPDWGPPQLVRTRNGTGLAQRFARAGFSTRRRTGGCRRPRCPCQTRDADWALRRDDRRYGLAPWLNAVTSNSAEFQRISGLMVE